MTDHSTELTTPAGGPAARRDSDTDGSGEKERSASLWADARRELYRNPIFVVSSLLVLAVISMAAFPTLWTDANPERCPLTNALEGPSDGHVFGTTVQGCDMYAHVIYGSRPSIIIAVFVTAAVSVVGAATGIVAGFYGGWVDTILSRITDVFLGIPFLLGALTFLVLLSGNQNIWTISLVLIVLSWTYTMRIMRGSVIAVKSQDYVEAARALGASNLSIIFRHILPNAIAPVIVLATLYLGSFVSAEATLTFLGVGLQIPEISWGITIAEGQLIAVSQELPHLLVFPCTAVVITVLSFVLMGDALRDALDPKGR
ncbi:MAG: ABC transporter permease [Actinomycetota bacterium]|nr:ABC transporter permease [Actinomycetota bacterium]